MNTFEGKLIPEQIKVGIVAARFNEFITSKLLSALALSSAEAQATTIMYAAKYPRASLLSHSPAIFQ